ncbi:hypothetical protein NMY22_g3266 [Coprinellus aureogranulatus]|nr:hypothetical protein NMY22_g3266 [Coprinellus aureogranulatus]
MATISLDSFDRAILDALFSDTLIVPQDESKYYHLWGVVFELLNKLGSQHSKGAKRFTHAPQQVFRKRSDHAAGSANYALRSLNTKVPSEGEFAEEIPQGSTSSPPRSPRTRSENPTLISGKEVPIPEQYGIVEGIPPKASESLKRTFDDLGPEHDQEDEDDAKSNSGHTSSDESSMPSGNTSLDSNASPPFVDTDPTTRRIPDSTIFVHERGPHKLYYPVIILENKPLPERAVLFGASSIEPGSSWRPSSSKYPVPRVLYIYAVGAYYAAYEITKEERHKVPPFSANLEDIDLQYLFAYPSAEELPEEGDGQVDDFDRGFINQRLNPHLIELWTKVADW